MNSEDVTSYLNNLIKEGDVHRVKDLLKEIRNDYENSSDNLLRYCHSAAELESYLKEFSYLFMIEDGKVARTTDELESGRENADAFFENALKQHPGSVKIEEFVKHVDDAPSDVKYFIQAFYPETDFKRYLKGRPNIFYVHSKGRNMVSLIEKESVAYFKQALKMSGDGLHYTGLRGHIGQAPDHVRCYINDEYPTSEFRHFLENNDHAFVVNASGRVYLVR